MGEEFQESEVIFPDPNDSLTSFPDRESKAAMHKRKRVLLSTPTHFNPKSTSQPVQIPTFPNQYMCYNSDDEDYEGHVFDRVGGSCAVVVVPPHVIVARRVAAKTACSFYEHHGRPLKGRNLSQLRNSILRMTGFLEP